MITKPRARKPKLTARHHQLFLDMLPKITEAASFAFRDLDVEARREATAETVATAMVMFAALVRSGRESLAYPSVLSSYAIKRVRTGRKAATKLNAGDVTSEYCQQKGGITVERLDKYDREKHGWQEVILLDKRATPAEIVGTKLDFEDWLGTLPPKLRKMASFLASGERTGAAAKRFGVSAARISQVRRQLARRWAAFEGLNQSEAGLAAAPA